MSHPTQWPIASSALLPHHLDHLASTQPSSIYAWIPNSPTTFADDYRSVTYRDLNNAVNAFSWWINRTIGVPGNVDDFPTMVYMGPNDLRYPIILLGAVKAGYKVLFPTPRYSAEGLVDLISHLDANIMLVPCNPPPVVEPILSLRKMDVYQVPSLSYLLSQAPPAYPYPKTFAQARDEPLAILHTPGTTGFPKPIVWTHDWADSIAKTSYLSTSAGYENKLFTEFAGKTMITMMPPFHVSGFIGDMLFPLQVGTTVILPPSSVPPSATLVPEIVKQVDGKVDILCLPPPFIDQLGSDAELLKEVSSNVKSVFWIGGDVSAVAGDAISRTMNLFTDLGSTEMGLFPILRESGGRNRENWHYVRYHEALNMRFELVSSATSNVSISATEGNNGNVYEAVIVRNEDENGYVQSIFKLFPDLQEFRTGDLFVAHPHTKGLWKHYGRADDLLVFITSEKFYPTETERRISSHPDVEEAVLVGTRRTHAALLLKLKDGVRGIESVWPAIESLNEGLPEYVKVKKEMVLCVDQPFAKTAKGSLRRKAVGEEYAEALDELYRRLDGDTAP